MSEFFTRADWRPGKNRKRVKRVHNYGGKKVAPPAFVEAGKATRFKPGMAGARLCKSLKRDGTPCRMLALRGCNVCGAHGGWIIWARKGILLRTGKGQAIRAQRAQMMVDRTEGAPAELRAMPIYQQANGRDRMRMIRAWQTSAWAAVIRRLSRSENSATPD